MVEFALLLLVFALLLLGIYDFACAIRVSNTIANMSREGANLASRPSPGLHENPQAVMDVLAATAQPLDMRGKGMMFVTVVKGDRILSQNPWKNSGLQNDISSRIGTPSPADPNPVANELASLNLNPKQTAYVVEVFYNYQSLFSNSAVTLGKQFYSRTVF
ncbi:TadE/TadG family type IV pilus assembly protein [Geomonas azotofigens]|uniref:TadE/TadG family type IV pilus assembly protein n=1 Tax=Geomonas azotofigens TaxID=2843196 RepID=UPI001C1112FC|nr:TadE/TadG family type IV pilus assembly protein [Geomonas azotofigens]MBU5614646.1 pilus assembly protein [Geomonas azotofigens]